MMEELRLGAEENILLDTGTDENYKAKFENRVVVTNKRCVFLKAEEVHYPFRGIFPLGKTEEIKTEYRIEQDIKLNDIKETYAHLEKYVHLEKQDIKMDVEKGKPLIFCIEFKLMNGQKAIFQLFSYTKDVLANLDISLPWGSQLELNVNLINDMYLVDRLVRYINQLIRDIIKIKCSFCGMRSDSNVTKCPNCGATLG